MIIIHGTGEGHLLVAKIARGDGYFIQIRYNDEFGDPESVSTIDLGVDAMIELRDRLDSVRFGKEGMIMDKQIYPIGYVPFPDIEVNDKGGTAMIWPIEDNMFILSDALQKLLGDDWKMVHL